MAKNKVKWTKARRLEHSVRMTLAAEERKAAKRGRAEVAQQGQSGQASQTTPPLIAGTSPVEVLEPITYEQRTFQLLRSVRAQAISECMDAMFEALNKVRQRKE